MKREKLIKKTLSREDELKEATICSFSKATGNRAFSDWNFFDVQTGRSHFRSQLQRLVESQQCDVVIPRRQLVFRMFYSVSNVSLLHLVIRVFKTYQTDSNLRCRTPDKILIIIIIIIKKKKFILLLSIETNLERAFELVSRIEAMSRGEDIILWYNSPSALPENRIPVADHRLHGKCYFSFTYMHILQLTVQSLAQEVVSTSLRKNK